MFGRAGVLTKEQKIGFVLLSVFAILAIGLGFLQIRNTIYGPLALNNSVPVNIKDQVNTVDALRYRDTDGDSLSDFDELYVYGTSPYLYDTFSYGLSDKEVIAKGLPLCPKNQECESPSFNGTAVAVSNVSSTAAALQRQYLLGEVPPDIAKILQDPAQVRQMLLSSGMDQATLSKISDSQLKLVVGQLLSDTTTMAGLQTIQKVIPGSATINIPSATNTKAQ